MESVELFLAYAIRVEEEAALRYGQLADAMESGGNCEVGGLFRRLSDYSRLHLADAKARAGFREIPKMRTDQFEWPDLESPETAAIWAADPFLGRCEALEIALAAEQNGYDYYKKIFDETNDPEIRTLARVFVEEEGAHVAELKKWITASATGEAFPVES
jgi:rubrerythrin